MSKKLIPAILLFLILVGCGTPEKPPENVVARVGEETIDLKTLRNSILLEPQFATRTPARLVRNSQLRYLVGKKHYYLAARAMNMANDPELQPKIKYIRGQEILKAYINREFLEKAAVTDVEILQGVARLKQKIDLQHLYFTEENEARHFKNRLETGEKFEDLLAEKYQLPAGEINFSTITFGQIHPLLEETAYRLKAGEVSDPIPTQYGYHLLKVLDISENREATVLSGFNITQQAARVIRLRKTDARIRNYLQELAGNEKIQLNNRVLEILAEKTGQVAAGKYAQAGPMVEPITSFELGKIGVEMEEILDVPLLRFADGEMTIGEFLERLKEMPPYHRPYLNGRTRIAQSVIDMIRNDLLLAEAEKQGYDNLQEVQKNIQAEIKDLLATEFSSRFTSSYFKNEFPGQWEKMNSNYTEVKKLYPAQIDEKALYLGIKNPDSTFVEAPVPFFLKNRYVW